MKNYFCDRKYTSCDAHSTPCNRRNNSCHMKYINVTRKTFCDRKNTAYGKRSIICVTEGILPLKERIFLVTKNKEHLVPRVPGYIFPVTD